MKKNFKKINIHSVLHLGDRVLIPGESKKYNECIVSQVYLRRFALICLRTGNRWCEPTAINGDIKNGIPILRLVGGVKAYMEFNKTLYLKRSKS